MLQLKFGPSSEVDQVALVPIDRVLHAKTKIRPLPSFSFTAGMTVVQLFGSEIVTMSHELPVLLIRDAAGYVPAALLGLRTGQNLLLDAQGRWIGQHVPALWRRGPFRLAQVDGQQEGTMVLCLDDTSELINETEGMPLFDESGAPSPILNSATAMLSQLQRDNHGTRAICALLDRHGLIVPWMLEIPQPDGSKGRVADLYQVDEKAIAGLSAEALVEIRDAGALPLIYAHLLSLSRVNVLARLTKMADERSQKQAALKTDNLNLDRAFGIVEDDPFIF